MVHVLDDGLQPVASDPRNVCYGVGKRSDRSIVSLYVLSSIDRGAGFRLVEKLVCQTQARADHLSLLRQPFGNLRVIELAFSIGELAGAGVFRLAERVHHVRGVAVVECSGGHL